MGFSLSYLAVKGRGKESALDIARLQESGRKGMVDSQTTYCGTDMGNGWYLILSNDWNSPLLRNALPKISEGTVAMFCQVSEGGNFAACKNFENGVETWSVVRNADDDESDEVQTSGELPDVFASISNGCKQADQENEGVDYLFEIPVVVFESYVGFRYDSYPGHFDDNNPGFDVLAWIKPAYD